MDYSKINLGCGDDYRDGWLNVDYEEKYRPSDEGTGKFVLLDLEEKWPSEWDDEFDVVLVDNVFEHIHPRARPNFSEQCRRIMKDSGKLVMRLPTRPGWDVTHFPVPKYKWAQHPQHSAEGWSYEEVNFTKVGLGRVMPDPVAKLCLDFDVMWCVSQVEVILS